MKRNGIYLIISFYSALIFSQNGDHAYAFALEQYKKENFMLASKEFNRAIFLGSKNEANCFVLIADSYMKLGQYDLADSFFDKAYYTLKKDSLKNDVILKKTYSNILRKRFKNAYYEILNIDTLFGDNQDQQYWLYLGTIYYGLEEYDKSLTSFSHPLDTIQRKNLEHAFIHLLKMNKRHAPNKIETMSFILPGLGQVYTGNVIAGINSFTLLGGIFTGMIYLGLSYSPLDGIFLLGPWFQRYYMGGAAKAKQMAQKKQNDIKYQTFNLILDFENN